MTKASVLIVEDEENIAEVLMAYCQADGYQATHLNSGGQVVDHVQNRAVDLILLDLMLPEVDGITLCRQIRQFSTVPIIMVTAKTEEIDRLLGLELGADDYICKPFAPKEVMARIKAIFRRVPVQADRSIRVAELELVPDQYRVSYQGEVIDLTPSEFRLLEHLARHVDRVFTREQLIASVYADENDIVDRNIDTHIKNIRKKIKLAAPQFQAIESVYGVGYRLASGTLF